MELRIELPKATENRLFELARRDGVPVEVFATNLIQRAIENLRSFSAILSSFRQEVAESKIDDSTLDALFAPRGQHQRVARCVIKGAEFQWFSSLSNLLKSIIPEKF